MKEFFGFGGYQRVPEGYMSWQHLTFVSSLMVIMIALAVCIGVKNRGASDKARNRVLVWAAILLDSIEIFKIIMMCVVAEDAWRWLYELPLFLCSIQLITVPLAAFAKGRVKEAALDFVSIFGILGAVMGTYFAGQNYACYPVLSFDNVVSGITHAISGFSSLYIMITGMTSMKRSNICITFGILVVFCIAAYVANVLLPYNYMFLMAGDGTPYDILYRAVNGSKVFYPLGVVAMFLVYIVGFYAVYYLIGKLRRKG